MKRFCIDILLLAPIVFLCAEARGAEGELSREKLVQMGKPATALMECAYPGGRTHGTAFCVDPSGLFVTSTHVLSNPDIPKITLILDAGLKTQRVIPAKIVRQDKETGLALLRAEGVKDLPVLPLGSVDGVVFKTEIITFGFPLGTLLSEDSKEYPAVSVNVGKVTAVYSRNPSIAESKSRIEVDAVLYPGNSGGPVLDRKGKVIGVVGQTNRGTRDPGLSLVIPVSYLTALLAVPDLEFTLPTVAQTDMQKDIVIEAKVLPLFPQSKPYRLELLLEGADGKERKTAMTEKDGVYRARAIPAPPLPLRMTVAYSHGAVTGGVMDRTVRLDGKELKLSQLRFLRWKPSAQVILEDGKVVDGVITGLGELELELGKGAVRPNLTSAIEARFEAASSPTFVTCTVIAFLEDKEVGRSGRKLTFALPAGPPVVNPYLADIVAAWQKAGAEVGWLELDAFGRLEFHPGSKGQEGEVPAFKLADWKEGLSKLPRPPGGFGLSFRARTVTDAGLKELAGFPTLQALDLRSTGVTDAGLKELAGLNSLQALDLGLTPVTDEGLKELVGLKFLRSLNLGETKVTDEGLKELAALNSLQALNLSATPVTDAGLKELAGLKALRALDLRCTGVTDAGLKTVAGLKSLQALNLRHTPVTDMGLKELAGLKSLQALNLSNTGVTDAGLKELAGLKSLQSLDLGYNRVTDAGLKELVRLKSLQSLDLSFARVTDGGLKNLAELKSLRWLEVTATNATDACIAELQKALPGLKVERH
jgi:internalin A